MARSSSSVSSRAGVGQAALEVGLLAVDLDGGPAHAGELAPDLVDEGGLVDDAEPADRGAGGAVVVIAGRLGEDIAAESGDPYLIARADAHGGQVDGACERQLGWQGAGGGVDASDLDGVGGLRCAALGAGGRAGGLALEGEPAHPEVVAPLGPEVHHRGGEHRLVVGGLDDGHAGGAVGDDIEHDGDGGDALEAVVVDERDIDARPLGGGGLEDERARPVVGPAGVVADAVRRLAQGDGDADERAGEDGLDGGDAGGVGGDRHGGRVEERAAELAGVAGRVNGDSDLGDGRPGREGDAARFGAVVFGLEPVFDLGGLALADLGDRLDQAFEEFARAVAVARDRLGQPVLRGEHDPLGRAGLVGDDHAVGGRDIGPAHGQVGAGEHGAQRHGLADRLDGDIGRVEDGGAGGPAGIAEGPECAGDAGGGQIRAHARRARRERRHDREHPGGAGHPPALHEPAGGDLDRGPVGLVGGCTGQGGGEGVVARAGGLDARELDAGSQAVAGPRGPLDAHRDLGRAGPEAHRRQHHAAPEFNEAPDAEGEIDRPHGPGQAEDIVERHKHQEHREHQGRGPDPGGAEDGRPCPAPDALDQSDRGGRASGWGWSWGWPAGRAPAAYLPVRGRGAQWWLRRYKLYREFERMLRAGSDFVPDPSRIRAPGARRPAQPPGILSRGGPLREA
jgi:hypothetical protein